ncbi:MAG: glutathione S-transferase family protein [Pseudomonadales bacterium]|jgi:glutathione S-transferase|nr:glutathione S-transferase family protein [Pseudomonadales bacterium]
MKLYDSVGPNPHVVRMFIAEKGMSVPTETVDIMAGANREADYLAKNPAGGSPCLELDDGSFLSEITAICEYLEELQPEPALVGATPEQRAETRMWVRRIDLNICEPLANGFRFSEGLPMFEHRMRCLPEAADGLKAIARDRLEWLDGLIAGREYVCGDRLTLADILLFAFVKFGAQVGQPLPEHCGNVKALVERLGTRAAASA